MTDNLVEQLRTVALLTAYDVCRQAADRIDKLEKSLKFCVDAIEEWEKRPDGIEPYLLGALDHARKTLGSKKDD